MDLHEYVVSVFLVFCRIGGCLMIVPGLSTARVPARVRLLLSLVLAMVVAPVVVIDTANARVDSLSSVVRIFGELVAGASIGLLVRVEIELLEFAGVTISNCIGLNSQAVSYDGGSQHPALVSLLTTMGVWLMIQMDLQHYVVTGVIASYEVIPVGQVVDGTGLILGELLSRLRAAYVIGLQLSGPFIAYAVVVNMMFGIVGRLVHQIPVNFVSVPFVAFGGLFVLYFAISDMMNVFSADVALTLRR